MPRKRKSYAKKTFTPRRRSNYSRPKSRRKSPRATSQTLRIVIQQDGGNADPLRQRMIERVPGKAKF